MKRTKTSVTALTQLVVTRIFGDAVQDIGGGLFDDACVESRFRNQIRSSTVLFDQLPKHNSFGPYSNN